MPHRIQCLVCRHMLSAHNSSKPYYEKLDVDYAYCERCYREKVGQLEATIASYRAAARRDKEEQGKYCLLDHARRVQFLARGWKSGPELNASLPDLACNLELQHKIPTCQGDLLFSDVLLVPADGPPVPAHKAILVGCILQNCCQCSRWLVYWVCKMEDSNCAHYDPSHFSSNEISSFKSVLSCHLCRHPLQRSNSKGRFYVS